MKIDQTTANIIAQFEAVALQVFNNYHRHFVGFLPEGPISLHTIMHKRPEGDRKGTTLSDLIGILVRSEPYTADLMCTISGPGYKYTFPKYEVFGMLEGIAHAADYPTAKLQRYNNF